MVTFEYNPEWKGEGTYGSWKCPTCGNGFYGGGEALHKRDCPDKKSGYSNCIYRFVRYEVDQLKKGKYPMAAPGSFTLEVIKTQFPELLEE